MKKFAMAAVAVAAMTVGVAQAYDSGTFTNGAVVPNVIHNGSTQYTAVGLVNQTGRTVPVFWTFFDQDSNHKTDGCFVMTDKAYRGFNWLAESGLGLDNVRGYLVFAVGGAGRVSAAAGNTTCADTTHWGSSGTAAGEPGGGALLSVHAFQVDTADKDVAFTPVIDGNLRTNVVIGPIPRPIGGPDAGIAGDLTAMGPDSVGFVRGAAQSPAVGAGTANFSMRYYLENGAKTNIVVWSTGRHNRSHTVNMFNNAQERKSVNFDLTKQELDWFDPSTIAGRPANFVDGFIEWNANNVLRNAATPPAAIDGSIFTYSVLTAPAFGAVQTVLGMHR